MKSHITAVMNHFKGKVTEWDVVNECLDDDQAIVRTNPEAYNLRQTVWQRAIGDDYIDSAFVYAHRADPTAVLYLNDYDVELQGTAKAVAFYNLAMRLRATASPSTVSACSAISPSISSTPPSWSAPSAALARLV